MSGSPTTGHVDLALRFLEVAATQANLADPGKSARSAVSAAALRVTVRPDDARLLGHSGLRRTRGVRRLDRGARHGDRDRAAAGP